MMRTSLINIKSEGLFRQFLRYFVAGGIAFVVDISLLYMFAEGFGLHYLISASIAFMAGISATYIISVTWVFSYRSAHNKLYEFTMFFLVGIIGLLLNAALMWLFTDQIKIHYIKSKILATMLIFVFNFTARKILLFSNIRNAR